MGESDGKALFPSLDSGVRPATSNGEGQTPRITIHLNKILISAARRSAPE